ncbi:MCE family protein [Nocardioides jiangxiensis]|uniref:MCE family protein n=1 Tax=Nocardioides jiangxiensis TaxID=3064524 RepID=A0ABT9AZ68_9ACTN|nr:MCE family protein [Nocardioides sp. WY-20]MDO7867730.1 MCE family protein [Nocardioides sp. WY-20]
MKKFLIPGIIALLVLSTALVMFSGSDRKTLVAHFPRTVSVYEGSDVRVLGVGVGTVDKVEPSGTDVVVTMSYPSDVKVPADAKAVIIAPSVVGDRFVQLTPAYDGGPTLKDHAVLDESRTSIPLDLDQIYQSLDNLVTALGPDGANKDGALSDLLVQTAKNFSGQGEKFNQTVHDLSKLTGTLDDNREELFGAAAKLEAFVNTLAKNDGTVRKFNQSLSDVSALLAGERTDLASSLHNLAVAMGQVSTFVKDNQAALGRNIKGLNKVAKVLVRQRAALDETLTNAPVALVNLGHAYNPQAGTLDTRTNLGEVLNQLTASPSAVLCALTNSKTVCNLVKGGGLQLPGLLRAGALRGVPSPQPYDLTLGGLVEEAR